MKTFTKNLPVLLMFVFVLSCKNNENDSKVTQSAQVEEVEVTSPQTKRTPKAKADEPCEWLNLQDLNQAFGFNISESADLDGEINDTYSHCLYSFSGGYMQLIHKTDIPKPFKGDASKYLEFLFKNHESGQNKRDGFSRVENLSFPAGWTSSETKFFGNTLNFVIDNKMYEVKVVLTDKPNAERKRVAIEIAKLLNK